MSRILCFTVIALQASLAILLARHLGTRAGLSLHIFAMLLFSAVGWFLLKQLTTESITWRNRVITLLMPWPSVIGGGSLPAFVIKNALASIAFALLVVAVDRYKLGGVQATTTDSQNPATGLAMVAWTTFLCWIVLSIAWLRIVQSTLANRNVRFSSLHHWRSIAMPLLMPPILIGASIALRYYGYAITAMLTVAVPMFVVLMPVLLMLAMMLYHCLTGKPIRWN